MSIPVEEHRALVQAAAQTPLEIAAAEGAEQLSAYAKCFEGELWWRAINTARNIRSALGTPRDRSDDWPTREG